jgi:endonuclease YncB( thermonuclease family)
VKRRASNEARRFQRRWPWVLAAVAIGLLVLADRSGLLLARQGDDLSRYDGKQFRVVQVVSPHTLQVQQADPVARRSTTRVRLWGVTAPLLAGPNREPQPFADEAMALSHELAHDQHVILHLETSRTRDTFNRVLAHVELADGSTLNEALLEAGLAQVDERSPHAMLTPYAQAQHRAQRARRGMWAE